MDKLIAGKRAAARPQDKQDIVFLEALCERMRGT